MQNSKHILSIEVKNKPGVMSHVCGLFTRRGYNIESIAVGVTHDPKVSMITIVLRGSHGDLKSFQGQLLKLPDILMARELPYYRSLRRELLLIRVEATLSQRDEIFRVVEVFGGKIAEITEASLLIEIHGNSRRIQSVIAILKKFNILEVARTGQVALPYKIEEV